MSMEWFNRVTSELHDHLNSICDQYDQVGHMSIDQSAKHPRIEFFVETEDDERDYFCTLHFDPHNVEFYVETFDFEFEQQTRIILTDIEDIIDAIHDIFHDFISDDELDDLDEEFVLDAVNSGEYYVGEIADTEFEELSVEWETPEVTAFQIEDEIEVTHQFGVIRLLAMAFSEGSSAFGRKETSFIKKKAASSFQKKRQAHSLLWLRVIWIR